MAVRIIKWNNIIDSCGTNLKMKKAFERFKSICITAKWSKPQDIQSSFNNIDLITCINTGKPRVVFNVGANKYRLICGYLFLPHETILYVKFVGNHKAYDAIKDICLVDMFK